MHITAHDEAAEKVIPERPKMKQRVPWETKAVIDKRNDLKRAAAAKRINATRSNVKNYNIIQKDLADTYDKEQQTYIQSQIDLIKTSVDSHQSSLAWQTVNKVTGRKNSTRSKLRANSDKERIEKWKEHFQNL